MSKFCANCGNELDDRAVICPKCGVQAEQITQTNNSTSNGMAVAGFVLAFFVPLLGLIFSIIGLKKSKETNDKRGLSIAGIIISSVSMVIGLILAIISMKIAFGAVNNAYDTARSRYNNNYYHYNYYD